MSFKRYGRLVFYMVLRSTPVAVKIFLLFWALGGNEISSLLGHSNLVVPHPQRITGKLPNGISYTFLPNDKPENRLSLRLIVATGAFMEKDREDGLAHFIEHMAFNGSVHFPSGSLIKYFQRIGMGFGNDTNAATSLTHTVYKLELPGCSEEEIRQGFTVLTDYAHGVLFPAEEIDRERGVILSELRTRDTPQHRIGKEQMKFLFPHHLLSKRFVIGTTDTLNGFRREDFLSFYKRWYTSDRMHLVAVGPVNPDKLLQQMKESFGALPSSKSRKDPPMGKITRPKGRPVGIWNEPELTHATIE
ncbi:MAG: insulinase family protein, partial [Puniceicoccales bacterium]|nr:insulinase family protein [Puniceicoccales bacterium]